MKTPVAEQWSKMYQVKSEENLKNCLPDTYWVKCDIIQGNCSVMVRSSIYLTVGGYSVARHHFTPAMPRDKKYGALIL